MRLILCGLVFLTTAALAVPVEDDLDRLIKERGLVTQMTDQLTQQISNQLGGPLQSARNAFGGKASELVMQAMGLLGVPYKRGGTSEEKGFDCSGFVQFIFRHALNIRLPRMPIDMSRLGLRVSRDELAPGDLVFFNTRGGRFTHVGIYINDAQFIHSPMPGTRVTVSRMDSAYYRHRFTYAVRIPVE